MKIAYEGDQKSQWCDLSRHGAMPHFLKEQEKYMKKIMVTVALMGLLSAIAYGQGYIDIEGLFAGIETNTSSLYAQNQGNFTTGLTDRDASFYYALLCSPTLPSGATDPSNGAWTLVTQQGGANLALTNSAVFLVVSPVLEGASV
jgi:hypothetical protein